MITLGSVSWGSGPVIPIAFAYEKRRSGADMQYRVQVTISSITGSKYFGYPIYLKLTINGGSVGSTTLKAASPSQWSSAITYTSGWYTVSNKISGTTPAAFQVYSGSGSSRNNTYTYSMAVDPTVSTVSAPNGTLSTPLTLTVTRYNTGFTHTITYKCGTVTGTVVEKSTATSVVWDNTNGNVSALAAQNTSGLTVNVTFTTTTYSGTSVVGTHSTTVSMAAPADAKPSVAITVEDVAGYFATYDAYVQGWSKLKITATPTLAYGSPIKTYAITADGKSYNTSPVTTDVVQGKDTLAVTAKVTDNRGQPSDLTSVDITVLEYSKPSVTAIAYRCNSSGDEDQEGAYMRVGFESTIASLNGKNTASYTIDYGRDPISGTGTSYLSDPIECDVSRVWSVEVVVSDDFDSTTKAATIPIAFTLLDFYRTGMGVAMGKVATRDGFDCAMPAYFTNEVHVKDVYINDEPLVDYIVEQGVEDDWTYRKWNSGIAECWCTISHSPVNLGGDYNEVDVWLPFTFANTDYLVQITSKKDSHIVSSIGDCNRSGTVTHNTRYFELSYLYTNASAYAVSFNVHVIGRWK